MADRSTTPSALPRGALLLLLALALLPNLNALSGGLVFDDHYLVTNHPAVQRPFSLKTVLSSPLLGGVPDSPIWRPLTTLSIVLDWRIGGRRPFWLHAMNLLLYAGTTLLWWLLLRRLLARREPADAGSSPALKASSPGLLALVAASLFAAHPIHTEAVAWISGRTDLLAAFWSLVALCLALDDRRTLRALTPLAVLLALGSKESAAMLPVLLLYTRWAFPELRKKLSANLILSSFVSVLVYLVLRRITQGTWFHQGVADLDNPLLGVSFAGRIPTVLDNVGRYLLLLLWPARLSVDYSPPVLGVVHGLTLHGVIGLLALAGLLFLAVARRSTPAGWGAGFAALTFTLASNLFLVVVTLFAERLLFLPSAGLLLVLSAGLVGTLPRLGGAEAHERAKAEGLRGSIPAPVRFALLGLWILVLTAGGVRTWVRNRDYHDDATMFAAGVLSQPRSYKLHANLSMVLLHRGENQAALVEAQKAIDLLPRGREARDLAAQALVALDRREDAVAFLKYVLRADPEDRSCRRRLLSILSTAGRATEWDSVAAGGMRDDPEEVEWVSSAARGAQLRRDYGRAAEFWGQVLRRAPADPEAPLNQAFCLLQIGNNPGAREAYSEALRRDPASAAAANGLAWTILETGGSSEEAVRLAEKAAAGEPVGAYFDTLARAYQAAGRLDKALEAANRACALDPKEPSYEERRRAIARATGRS